MMARQIVPQLSVKRMRNVTAVSDILKRKMVAYLMRETMDWIGRREPISLF